MEKFYVGKEKSFIGSATDQSIVRLYHHQQIDQLKIISFSRETIFFISPPLICRFFLALSYFFACSTRVQISGRRKITSISILETALTWGQFHQRFIHEFFIQKCFFATKILLPKPNRN